MIDRERRKMLGYLFAGSVCGAPLVRTLAATVPGPQPGSSSKGGAAVVARARREGLFDLASGKLDGAKVDDALGAAIARAAGEGTAVDACRALFTPKDVVGIKVNCIAGRGLSTRPEVAHRVASWLVAAGVPARQVVIWDRTDRELEQAGFKLDRSGNGVRVYGTNDAYRPDVVEWGPAASRFPQLLDEMTALIDLAVLKHHSLAGVSFGMKNWYGAVHNPNKLHGDRCQPFIPHLAAAPQINGKLRLTIVDGTTGQCHAGPGRSPQWAWAYGGFIVSRDPVAVDAVALQVIEERRREVKLKPLAADGTDPQYIAAAGKLGLGEADAARIRIEDV